MVTTAMDQEEVSYCQDCNGIVKPDVVFFGESLPPRFMEHFFDIAEADLVIIMGTSLKVYPFASLLSAMPADTPVVLINREDNADLQQRKSSFLHLGGSIEDNIEDLATKLGLNL
jgi:NAD-dependent histone deacetylase SIR2